MMNSLLYSLVTLRLHVARHCHCLVNSSLLSGVSSVEPVVRNSRGKWHNVRLFYFLLVGLNLFISLFYIFCKLQKLGNATGAVWVC